MHARLKVNSNQTLAKHYKDDVTPQEMESFSEDGSLTTGCGCAGTLVCVGGALTGGGPPVGPLEIRGWTED